MLDVGIEVEVRAHGGAQPLLIGQRAPGSTRDRRPTPGAFPVGGQNYGAGYLFLSEGKTMGQAIYFSLRANYGAGYL